jgi:hypothetical protein
MTHRELVSAIVGAAFGAVLIVMLIGFVATQQDAITARNCDRMGRVILDGNVYECRRIAAIDEALAKDDKND